MPWLSELAVVITRALHLLALSVVPQGLSPEPVPSHAIALPALLAVAALAAILVVSAGFASWLGSRLSRIGGGLAWVAVAAALGAALYFRGPHAPLARGAPLVAVPVWAALAVLAAASAEQWLGSSFKHRRMGAAILTLAIGVTLLVRAAPYLGSRGQMWWSALRRDAAHERAVQELTGPFLKKRQHDQVVKVADRCLDLHPLPPGDAPAPPATCACLELRAEARLRARAPAAARARAAEGALQDAQRARARCPDRKGSRATLAEALALTGHEGAAQQEAWTGIEEGGDPARLRFALALVYDRAGRRAEALQEAALAIDAGAGRDARLLAGAISILSGDLDGAARWLEPLVKEDPGDTEAQYNLALIADKRGVYNRAREGYLAALRADPRNADARYNLAWLTFRAGATEEARHHVRRFLDAHPEDPRGRALAQGIGIPSPGPGAAPEPPAPK